MNVRNFFCPHTHSVRIILPTESAMFGQSYTLSCEVSGVSGAEIMYQWSRPGPGIRNAPQLNFSPISLSDAGKYNCTATFASYTIRTAKEISVSSE